MSKRVKTTHVDPEVHARHLKRQLESLEKDNHQSLNDIDGLISIALSAQEDDGKKKNEGIYVCMYISYCKNL